MTDLETLAIAAARDPGNRLSSWTPQEVQAADRVDDAYDLADLAPRGYWGLQAGDED